MKDFLYLDNDTISSISAQLFEGNVSELLSEKSSTTGNNITDSYSNTETEATGGKVAIPGVIDINGTNSSGTSDSKQIAFVSNDTVKQSSKKAYDDFLYNRILDELNDKELIADVNDCEQFDYVKLSGEYNFVDMSTISNLFDTDLIFQLPFLDQSDFSLPEVKELKQKFSSSKQVFNPKAEKIKGFSNRQEAEYFYETMKNMKIIEVLKEISLHLDKALKDKVVLEKDNAILIGDRKYLRIPSEILTLTGKINIEGLGRIISNPNDCNTIEETTNFNIEEFKGQPVLSIGAKSFLLLFLQLLLDLNDKDTFKLIHPIGLEFSKVSR